MPRVVHFEIHAADPERVIAYYQALFGWRFDAWGPPGAYWLITTGADGEAGINGGLVPRRGSAAADGQPVNAFVCTVDVADLAATLKKLGELGGFVVVPRMPVPTVGYLAYAKDTEGNIFGMIQALRA